MYIVILILVAGMALGHLLPRKAATWPLGTVVTLCVGTLLFVMGLSLGSNAEVMGRLTELSGTALLLAVAGVGGSALGAALLWRLPAFRRRAETLQTEEATTGETAHQRTRKEGHHA